MVTKAQQDAIDLYAQLMEEVKVRISATDKAVSGQTGLPEQIVRDLCFLQLRMLCELIALGCLVAHGDIRAKSGLTKVYAADFIIKRLEQLHPNFYPRPIDIEPTKDGIHIEKSDADFLTKAELLVLYRQCGDRLHRGTVRKLLSEYKVPAVRGFPDIVNWTNKIIALLTRHHIASFDNREHWICTLRNRDNANKVQVAFASYEDS